jgi:hypothetical protein
MALLALGILIALAVRAIVAASRARRMAPVWRIAGGAGTVTALANRSADAQR